MCLEPITDGTEIRNDSMVFMLQKQGILYYGNNDIIRIATLWY